MNNYIWLIIICGLFAISCHTEDNTKTMKDSSVIVSKDTVATEVPATAITAGEQYAFLKKMYVQNNQWFCDVEFIDFLTGDAALTAAKKDGVAEKEVDEDGKVTYFVPNDYYIVRKKDASHTLSISPEASIKIMDETGNTENLSVIKVEKLAKTFHRETPYILNIANKEIKGIREQFIP